MLLVGSLSIGLLTILPFCFSARLFATELTVSAFSGIFILITLDIGEPDKPFCIKVKSFHGSQSNLESTLGLSSEDLHLSIIRKTETSHNFAEI